MSNALARTAGGGLPTLQSQDNVTVFEDDVREQGMGLIELLYNEVKKAEEMMLWGDAVWLDDGSVSYHIPPEPCCRRRLVSE